ncbi:MAG: cbb3-type cytochrome c oxidase subunit I [Rhizobiales bacterium]|nr:cbb3-type cytochrome c oxidase subunit I [Hyphomicrobiales bacterium]
MTTTRQSLAALLRDLPAAHRALLTTLVVSALVTLGYGVLFGALTAFVRAGFFELHPETGYRFMTLHGVTIFFYWLYFGQATMLLALAAAEGGAIRGIKLAPAAWLGTLLMLLGFTANQIGAWTGPPLLYDASPEVAGEERVAAGMSYVGYLLLAAGLFLVAASAIATALAAKAAANPRVWSTIGFGVVTWAGLLMVSSVAAVNAFLPSALWAYGLADMPTDPSTGWHLLFHNLHYLPLMGTVLIWYALIREMTGVKSIFGSRFSKIVFASYLIFVPPTSLYHMFLEPGLAPLVRVLGSLLSLFISVPTVAVFLVIVVSLEASMRARGSRGLFAWMRALPWRTPEMAAIGAAVVNLGLGGSLAFVLIQERLATLLSDTFFVPAYFHFLTVGTVSLTLLAGLMRITPALTGALRAPRLLALMPVVVTVGLVLFGFAGIFAGISGMPRRVLDASYDGAAPANWLMLSQIVGVGAILMAAGLLIHVAILLAGIALPVRRTVPSRSPAVLATPDGAAFRQAAWTGPLSVVLLVAAMYAITIVAFSLMQALPVVASAGGH